jgi:hypothetical protein
MLILFDHGTPRGLAHILLPHTVYTAQAKGWDRLENGALLTAAEVAAFERFATHTTEREANTAGIRPCRHLLARSHSTHRKFRKI